MIEFHSDGTQSHVALSHSCLQDVDPFAEWGQPKHIKMGCALCKMNMESSTLKATNYRKIFPTAVPRLYIIQVDSEQ